MRKGHDIPIRCTDIASIRFDARPWYSPAARPRVGETPVTALAWFAGQAGRTVVGNSYENVAQIRPTPERVVLSVVSYGIVSMRPVATAAALRDHYITE